mgnify:CR=1 FL=1
MPYNCSNFILFLGLYVHRGWSCGWFSTEWLEQASMKRWVEPPELVGQLQRVGCAPLGNNPEWSYPPRCQFTGGEGWQVEITSREQDV